MKIVVAGGRAKADFLINALLKKKYKVAAISDSEEYSEYLVEKYKIPVTSGSLCKKYILDEAEIHGFDVLVGLSSDDAENLAVCQMASELYQIKKTVCIVSNPWNVDLFRQLGVSNVISETYMLAGMIDGRSQSEWL